MDSLVAPYVPADLDDMTAIGGHRRTRCAGVTSAWAEPIPGSVAYQRIVGVDLAGISSAGAKSAVAEFARRDEGFELTELRSLDPADRTPYPDQEFLDSLDAFTLLVIDSPLQWPALLRSADEARAVERHWAGPLSQRVCRDSPKERFSLVRDRLCEKCMLARGVPVNNPGVNLGGVVARAIYWRQYLTGRVVVIEVNPDSIMAHVGLARRDGSHRWYRPVDGLHGSISLGALFGERLFGRWWPNVGVAGAAHPTRELRPYTAAGSAGSGKDLLMAIAAGLCGVSYAMGRVILPCTATGRSDIGEPFESDGWMYLPRREGEPWRCRECSGGSREAGSSATTTTE